MALEAIVALAVVAMVFASAQLMMTQSLRQAMRARDIQTSIEALMRMDGCFARLSWSVEAIGAPPKLVERGFCDEFNLSSEPDLPAILRSARPADAKNRPQEEAVRLLILALPPSRGGTQ